MNGDLGARRDLTIVSDRGRAPPRDLPLSGSNLDNPICLERRGAYSLPLRG